MVPTFSSQAQWPQPQLIVRAYLLPPAILLSLATDTPSKRPKQVLVTDASWFAVVAKPDSSTRILCEKQSHHPYFKLIDKILASICATLLNKYNLTTLSNITVSYLNWLLGQPSLNYISQINVTCRAERYPVPRQQKLFYLTQNIATFIHSTYE